MRNKKQSIKNTANRVICVALLAILITTAAATPQNDTLIYNYQTKKQTFNSSHVQEKQGIGILIQCKKSHAIRQIFCFEETEQKATYFYNLQDTIYYLFHGNQYTRFEFKQLHNLNYDMNYFRYFPLEFKGMLGSQQESYAIERKERENKKNRFVTTYLISHNKNHIIYTDTIQSVEVGNQYIYASFRQVQDPDSLRILKHKLHHFITTPPEKLGYQLQNNQDERQVIAIGDTLKNHEFETLTSQKVAFRDVGAPIKVIDFWYTSCIPCIKLMKAMPEIQSNFDSTVAFISLNNKDRDKSKIHNTLNFHNIKQEAHQVIWIETAPYDFTKAYRIALYPTLIIVDSDLVVLDIIEGYTDRWKRKITKRIQRAVQNAG